MTARGINPVTGRPFTHRGPQCLSVAHWLEHAAIGSERALLGAKADQQAGGAAARVAKRTGVRPVIETRRGVFVYGAPTAPEVQTLCLVRIVDRVPESDFQQQQRGNT